MAAADDSPLVLVTGASGYIGSHIIKQLQDEGYRVRGTVRSLENEDKVKPLQEMCPEAQHKLELVEADLTKEDSWESAVKGCTFMIHVASPYPAQIAPTEDDVLKPAVDGINAILKACQKEKIQRLVLTSALSAIMGGRLASENDPNKTYNEEDWADPEKVPDAYTKSKVVVEKTAWDFIKELPEEERFELVVINPAHVMGPVICGAGFTSMEIPKRLLERTVPAVPKVYFPVVDVRDVATAHVKALTEPKAAGQRHILFTSGLWMKELAQMIAKEFKPQGYSVPTMHCPYFAMWVKSLFDKNLKVILPNLGKSVKIDNTKMKEIFGIEPHEVQDTVIEMCYSMIEAGLVKKAKKYRGPKKEGEGEEANAEEGTAEDAKEANGTVTSGGDDAEKKEEDGGEKKDDDTKEDKSEEKKEEESKEEEKPEEPATETEKAAPEEVKVEEKKEDEAKPEEAKEEPKEEAKEGEEEKKE